MHRRRLRHASACLRAGAPRATVGSTRRTSVPGSARPQSPLPQLRAVAAAAVDFDYGWRGAGPALGVDHAADLRHPLFELRRRGDVRAIAGQHRFKRELRFGRRLKAVRTSNCSARAASC